MPGGKRPICNSVFYFDNSLTVNVKMNNKWQYFVLKMYYHLQICYINQSEHC